MLKFKIWGGFALAASLSLSACQSSVIPTGISIGGCFKNPETGLCADAPRVAAQRLERPVLHLPELPESLLLRLQDRLPIEALLSGMDPAKLPEGSFVEFFVDGQAIGQVSVNRVDLRSILPTFYQSWNELTPGLHRIRALLKSPDGQVLAESNQLEINMPVPDPNRGPGIVLLNPVQLKSVPVGTRVPVRADVFTGSGPRAERIEFFAGDRLIGKGTLQADGSYLIDWNTEGWQPGNYPVRAVIKTADGTVIARSQLADVLLEAGAELPNHQQKIGLGLVNLEGLSTFPLNSDIDLLGAVNLPPSLRVPGNQIFFYANGQIIGQGRVDASGHYQITWKTSGFQAGEYEMEARLRNAQGQTLATSNNFSIQLMDGMQILEPPAADPIDIQLASLPATHFPGDKIQLNSGIKLPEGANPNDYEVVFFANGQRLGTGQRNSDGSWTYLWDSTGFAEGDYPLQAKLFDRNGQELDSSSMQSTRLSAQSRAAVTLQSGDLMGQPGETLKLRAAVSISAQERANGAFVEFFADGERVGRGRENSDGSWEIDWDTTGLNPGDYNIEAVLKSNSGATLARSNVAKATLGSSRPQINLLTQDAQRAQGDVVPLRAGIQVTQAQLNDGAYVTFLRDGRELGRGVRQSDGTWLFDWGTQNESPGSHEITAVLYDGGGTELARSSLATIELTSSAQPSIQLVNPASGISATLGTQIPLDARISVPPAIQQAGVTVSFFRNGVRIGTGQLQGDSRYTMTWDTNSESTGNFPITARLQDLSGSTLAETEIATVNLYTNSGSGSNSAARPEITLGTPLTQGLRALAGETLTLNAITVFRGPLDVTNSEVVFFADGAEIGRQSYDGDNNFSINWDTTGQPLGTRNITAAIQENGQTFATSNLGTVTVINNAVVLQTPANNSLFAVNEQILMRASAEISSAQAAQGAIVGFYLDNTRLGSGTQQPDGTWTFNWDSTGQTPGTFNANARLEVNGGSVAQSADNSIELFSNASTLSAPANNTQIPITSPVTLSGNVTLSPSQVAAGARLRFAEVDAGGNVTSFLSDTAASGLPAPGDNRTYPSTFDLTAPNSAQNQRYRLFSVDSSNTVIASSSVNLVQYVAPTATLTAPPDEQILDAGATHSLQGTATNVPSNGNVVFRLRDKDGTDTLLAATAGAGNSYSASWNTAAVTPGDYDLTLLVRSNANAVLTTSTARELALIDNAATLELPVDNEQIAANSSVTLRAQVALTPEQAADLNNAQATHGYNPSLRIEVRDNSNAVVHTANINSLTEVSANLYRGADATWNGTPTLGDYSVVAILSIQDKDAGGNVVTRTLTDTHNLEVVQAPAVTLNAPADASTETVGTTVSLSADATNVPIGGAVRFTVRNGSGTSILQTSGTAGAGNTYTANWNTDGLDIGAYTVNVEVLSSAGTAMTSDGPHTVNLNFLNNGTLVTPPDESLFYQERGPVTLRFIPKDDQGNPVSAAQMTGLTVEFIDNDATGQQSLGNGTRQADGSYTRSWDISEGVETTGNHKVKVFVRDGDNNIVYTSNENDTRLFPYPRTVFIIDGTQQSVYDTYTGPPVVSTNPDIESLATGQRKLIFSAGFRTDALAKHPSNGDFYYVESGGAGANKRLGRYNPSTKTETIITSSINSTGIGNLIRLGFSPSGELFMSGGGRIFHVNQSTGVETEVTLSGTSISATSSGDIAFGPNGVLYFTSNQKAYRIVLTQVAGSQYSGVVSDAGDLDENNGNVTSNGFDSERHPTGEPSRMLVLDNSGNFWSYPLNVAGNISGAATLIQTYGDHGNGDMTSAHLLP